VSSPYEQFMLSPFTYNLSSHSIDQDSVSLLDLGLKFIPTPLAMNLQTHDKPIQRVIRNIKLKDYFYYHPKPDTYLTDKSDAWIRETFTAPSSFTPRDSLLSSLTLINIRDIRKFKGDTIRPLASNPLKSDMLRLPAFKKNLSPAQLIALRKLKNNDKITIKQADKGGAVVIMDSKLYIQEGLRQLNNSKYYQPIDQSVTPSIIPIINSILKLMFDQHFISAKQLSFLKTEPNPSPRKFYMLPKIHKHPGSWPHPLMPAGRPIVSDCNSPTYNISKFIDSFLQPLSTRHSSYLKDTNDFISKVRNQIIPPHSFLVTGDLESLYTNLHHHLIISTIKKTFLKYPDPKRPDALILRLLIILLKNNDFVFNNQLYKQLLGAAMGFPFSPSCANIYLVPFDQALCNDFYIKPLLYGRFLDDVNMVWTGTEAQLDEFTVFANAIIPDIKITFTVERYCISFLDTVLYKYTAPDLTTRILTKVFFKSTDTHQLLHTSSNHPNPTFRSVLRSQFIRFKRISSSHSNYNQACRILFKTLTTRGYSKSAFRKLQREVLHLKPPIFDINDPSTHLAAPRMKKLNNSIFPIITHFDPINKKINHLIRRTLKDNPVFQDTRFISAFINHPPLSSLIKKK
jgi:hypothetical protein